MAVSFVNTQQPRIDAWIQPGCRADIAVVSTESWPVDTVVTIGVANAAGVIAVPLLTITPDLATLTATVALTGVQVAALAVACPPPYGVIDWQWRTGAGSPLGVGSLHWDLTGARTTQTVTVMMGPAGPTAVSTDPGNAAELGTDGLIFVSPTAGSAHVIRDEGAGVTDRPALDFRGVGVTVSDDPGSGATRVTISGGGASSLDDLTDVATAGADAGEALVSDGSGWVPSAAPVVLGTDSRLTDARTPTAHTHTLDATTDTATRVAMTPAERTKLTGVAAGATANATDAQLRDRATHTGTQAIATVTGLQTALDGKAAALGSDDNYVTDAEKAALHGHANKAALDAVSGTNSGDQTLPTWSTIAGKPAVVAAGATQGDARTAIGAGTSSFSGSYADLVGKPTLGDAAAKNTGTTAGTVAAGDDSRFGASGIPSSTVDAKGDLIVGTAADTVGRLAVGATTGHVLTVNPATASGLEWAAGGGGGGIAAATAGVFTFGYAGDNDQTLLAGNYLRAASGSIEIVPDVAHMFPMQLVHAVTVDGFRLRLATAGDASCQLQVALYAVTPSGVLGERLSAVWTVGATTTGEKYTTTLSPISAPAGLSVIVVISSGQSSTNPAIASSGNSPGSVWTWSNGEGQAARWTSCSPVTSLPATWTAGAATGLGDNECPILGLFF